MKGRLDVLTSQEQKHKNLAKMYVVFDVASALWVFLCTLTDDLVFTFAARVAALQ